MRVFICENVDGDQYFLHPDIEGPFGKPALVNEDSVVYDEETHKLYADLCSTLVNESIMKAMNDGVDPNEWAKEEGPKIEDEIRKRWAAKDYVLFDEMVSSE